MCRSSHGETSMETPNSAGPGISSMRTRAAGPTFVRVHPNERKRHEEATPDHRSRGRRDRRRRSGAPRCAWRARQPDRRPHRRPVPASAPDRPHGTRRARPPRARRALHLQRRAARRDPVPAARPRAAPGGRVAARQRQPATALLRAARRRVCRGRSRVLLLRQAGHRASPKVAAAPTWTASSTSSPPTRSGPSLPLRASPGVDGARVGFLGASAAGWVAPRAAEQSGHVRFVAIASPGVLQHSIVARFEQEAGDDRRPTDAIAREIPSWPRSGFDPSPFLERLRVPALWLFGGADRIVPAARSANALRRIQSRAPQGLEDRRLPQGRARPARRSADRSARCAPRRSVDPGTGWPRTGLDDVEPCDPPGQPPSTISAAPEGFGSGSRVIRKPFARPSSAASSGTSNAICSALGRAIVLMWRISAWTSSGWPSSS